MGNFTGACAALAIGAIATSLCFKTALAANEQCVRVVGYESDGEKQNADPAKLLSTDSAYHIAGVYEGLLDLDTSWQAVPRLAVSWESNADATEWTFHLRKGVKFHDGSDFTSADVVYTYRRILDPQTASAGRDVLKAMLTPEGIQAVDPYTVRFKLTRPVAVFPTLQREKTMLIVKNGTTTEELRTKANGTGPFTLEQFTPGGPVRILRRNKHYWQAGIPKSECLRITVIQETTSALAAILSGEADLLLSIDAASASKLKDNSNVVLVHSAGAIGLVLEMWIDTPPFNDLRVRQAMKLVVDRKVMLDTVLLGYGEMGNDNPVPPSNPDAFSKDVLQRDVPKAKQLLAEAGYPNGLSIDLYTGNFAPGALLLSQTYAQMAADAGIKVNLLNAPADTYYDDIWLKKPLITDSWGARAPALGLTIAYRTGAAWNLTHWTRSDYDALLDKANAEPDPAKRREILGKAQKMLATEGGVIWPVFASVISALRKGCTGYQPHLQPNFIDYRNLECN